MSAPSRPPIQNPLEGTTVDTSPEKLGLRPSAGAAVVSDEERSAAQRAVDEIRRKTSLLKRSGQKKLLGLSRTGRERDATADERRHSKSPPHSAELESPFQTHSPPPPLSRPLDPASPSTSRPSLADSFRGEGSLRFGTQTLIQALQAIPWEDDGRSDKSSESDDEQPEQSEFPGFTLSSSIHTIHRPVARIQKRSQVQDGKGKQGVYTTEQSSSSGEDDDGTDDEEDFDHHHSSTGYHIPPAKITAESPSKRPLHLSASISEDTPTPRGILSRSTSFSTVKLQRRVRLAEKLREVFNIDQITEVLSEMPCWLLRSVLLQGYMYLTNSHICFFAHMPSREDQVLKSGNLSKKAQRTRRWNKHWFVLKNDTLTWFQSSADPYFPHGVADLRYAISCDAHGDKGFRIRTNQKTISLDADSIPSRDEWVKAIRKVIFRAQNSGESVKIAIPYSAVLDVDRSKAMDFSEMIEVKVVDKDDDFLVDSYFFAYFHDISHAVEEIRDAVRFFRASPSSTVDEQVKDTTSHRLSIGSVPGVNSTSSTGGPLAAQSPERAGSTPSSLSILSRDRLPLPSSSRLASLLKPFSSGSGSNSSEQTIPAPIHGQPAPPRAAVSAPTSSEEVPSVSTLKGNDLNRSNSSWMTLPVPSWLKSPSRRLFPLAAHSGSTTHTPTPISTHTGSHVSDELPSRIYASASISESGEHNELGFSIVDDAESGTVDPVAVEKFRNTFALDEKETLVAEFPGYLFRVLPVFGKIDISTNYFCFRSSQPLTRTRMMIPLRDILNTEKQKAFRFGHHGLVVVIKGHEELFFEFNSLERRNAVAQILDSLIEDLRKKNIGHISPTVSHAKNEALVLQDLEPSQDAAEADPQPPPESTSEALPAVMFTSMSSTFLTFKPQESLHFTCLTIGSRGDVQPYIALAKGLQADGHRVRIATHLEFKDWIEGHGIEYGHVGGDPAELMRICVENGMFTVSFLRETMTKFRGWLDDLLKTSWEACQGTDVLIESPSAMGGIHIAEALRIPYYRAFTMPWTRTRAYPHAFAVPEAKMGGSYNYLTYVMFDQVFWRAMAGQINRWRRHMLKIQSTNLDKLEQHKVPFLYNFSPTVVPPPLDWYEWIRVTGYWFLDDPESHKEKKWEPPSDLVEFIDKAHGEGKKVVYIGFGSIVVSDPDAMTQCVIDSVLESGVYAIMSKGWSDRLSTKKADIEAQKAVPPLPPQIYNIGSVPHDWLFKRIDAACHHGGAGTTGASLRAGLPTIIKPFFGDQFFWADRVEALGIGSCVRKLTVDSLVAALVSATTDAKQIARAQSIGRMIQAENGVANAVEAIYRDLEYARSIIKQPPEAESYGAGSEDWSVISGDEDDARDGSTKQEPDDDHPKSPSHKGKAANRESWGGLSRNISPVRGGLAPTAWH